MIDTSLEVLSPIVAEIAAPSAVVFGLLSLDLPNDAVQLLPQEGARERLARVDTETAVRWHSVERVSAEPPDVVVYRMVRGPCAQLERRFHIRERGGHTRVLVEGRWQPGGVFARRGVQKQITLATRSLLAAVREQAERLARVRLVAPPPSFEGIDPRAEDPGQAELRLLGLVEQQEELEWGASGHGASAAYWADAVARSLRLPEEMRHSIRLAAALHDVGKIRIEGHLFDRDSTLSAAGQRRLEQHPQLGAALVAKLPDAGILVPAVRHHHERWDGMGYPDGLRENEAPLAARIISVAEAADAMQRPLPDRRGRLPLEVATILERHAGRQWDPDLAHRMAGLLAEYDTAQVKQA